ncbi:MAG: adenylate/guanylate cyclase domain-containing protein [bacterium]
MFCMALAFASNGFLAVFMYTRLNGMLYEDLRSKAMSIAATAASQMDGDKLARIKTRADESAPEYKAIVKQLRKMRDANRREDVYIKYMYTMMPDPEKPGGFLFGVDAEEKKSDIAHAGEVSEGRLGVNLDINTLLADERFTVDKWGEWLSGYAPVRTAAGKPVASLGVDMKASDVIGKMRRVLWMTVFAFAISLACSAGVSLYLANSVNRPLLAVREAVGKIGEGDLTTRLEVGAKDEFGEIAGAVNAMAKGLQEREMVKKLFSRYVSQQVVDSILKSGELPNLKGDRRRITAMFADVRGFSALAGELPPEGIIEALNECFEEIVETIFRHHGAIDKFAGDSMVVIFGAPLDDPQQEEHAVRAALEMRAALKALGAKWLKAGAREIRIGMGINTGMAVVGNIGSPDRMEYTAIGDTVDIAAALESETRNRAAGILVSEATAAGARGVVAMKEIGEMEVMSGNKLERIKFFTPAAEE